MPQFRKKPVVIEAIQFTGDNLFECLRFMGEPEDVVKNLELHATDAPIIHTLEGTMNTSPGDWIIRGVKGEFYPCKPDIFEATYDEEIEAKEPASQTAPVLDVVPVPSVEGAVQHLRPDEFARRAALEASSRKV